MNIKEIRAKLAEVKLDINKGDILLGGKYKNSPITVEEIGTDELGQPTVNGRKLLAYRIKKKMPAKEAGEKLAIPGAWARKLLKPGALTGMRVRPKGVKIIPATARSEPLGSRVAVRSQPSEPWKSLDTLPTPRGATARVDAVNDASSANFRRKNPNNERYSSTAPIAYTEGGRLGHNLVGPKGSIVYPGSGAMAEATVYPGVDWRGLEVSPNVDTWNRVLQKVSPGLKGRVQAHDIFKSGVPSADAMYLKAMPGLPLAHALHSGMEAGIPKIFGTQLGFRGGAQNLDDLRRIYKLLSPRMSFQDFTGHAVGRDTRAILADVMKRRGYSPKDVTNTHWLYQKKAGDEKLAVSKADFYAKIPRGARDLLSFFKPSVYPGETHNCLQGARKIRDTLEAKGTKADILWILKRNAGSHFMTKTKDGKVMDYGIRKSKDPIRKLEFLRRPDGFKPSNVWKTLNISRNGLGFGKTPKLSGFRDPAEREKLPYRQTAEIMMTDEKGNLVARKEPGFVKFPGGGVDKGESPRKALLREILEETGLTVGDVKRHSRVKWDWPTSWPKTEKQKQRYQQFRGEDSHIFTGRVKSRGKPTSMEGDAWPEIPSTPPGEVEEAYNVDHGDFAPYKNAQRDALKALLAQMKPEASAKVAKFLISEGESNGKKYIDGLREILAQHAAAKAKKAALPANLMKKMKPWKVRNPWKARKRKKPLTIADIIGRPETGHGTAAYALGD